MVLLVHHIPPTMIQKISSQLFADLRVRQKIILEFCGRVGYKDDSYIIHSPNFLPPSLRIYMNQFNELHGDEPTNPPK